MKNSPLYILLLILFYLQIKTASAQTGTKGAGVATNIVVTENTKGNVFALVVGVSKYQSTGLAQLKYADVDAKAFSAFLKSSAGGSVPAENIIEMYNEEATRGNIRLKGLIQLQRKIEEGKIKSGDMIYIYLSGHGGAFNYSDSYFFPYDAHHAQDAGSSISIRQIKNYISNYIIDGIRVVFILDACRSVTTGIGKEGIELVSKHLQESRGEIILASTSGGMEAHETSELGHGVYTYFLLDGLYGLADRNNDGLITGAELEAYLNEKVPEYTNQKLNRIQEPWSSWATYKFNPFMSVDESEKEKYLARRAKQSKGTIEGSTMLASKSLETEPSTPIQKSITDYYILFENALKKGDLIFPKESSALFYYNQIKKMDNNSNIEVTARFNIGASLMDAAQKVLLKELDGERPSLRSHPVTSRNRDDGSVDNLLVLTEGENFYQYGVQLMDALFQILPSEAEDNQTKANYLFFKAKDKFKKNKVSDFKDSYREMLPELEECLKLSPNSAHILHEKAFALYFTDKKDEALTLLEEVQNLAPVWSFPLNTLGKIYFETVSIEEGKKYFEKAATLNLKDPMPLINIGVYYESIGDIKESIKYYRKGLERDPLYYNGYTSIGKMFKEIDEYDSSITYFKKAAELNDYDSYAANWLGFLYMLKNDYPQAEKFYLEAIKIEPNNGYNLNGYGYVLEKQGRLDEALLYYTKATESEAKDVMFFRNAANVLYDKGEYEKAFQFYYSGLELNIEDASSWNGAGNALYYQENYRMALLCYETASSIKPNETAYIYNSANCFYDLEIYDSAMIYYRNVIEIDPNYSSAYMGIANIYNHNGEYDKAEEYYLIAYKANPQNSNTLYNLAVNYVNASNFEDAIKYFELLIKDFPNYEINNAILGDCYLKVLDAEKALYYYEKAINAGKADYILFFNTGIAYSNLANYEKAIEYFEMALLEKPDYCNAFINIWYYKYFVDKKSYQKTLQKLSYLYDNINKFDCDINNSDEILGFKILICVSESEFEEAVKFAEKGGLEKSPSLFYMRQASLAYTYSSNYEMGEKLMLKIYEQTKDYGDAYNLACLYSLKNDEKKAIEWLELALKNGYSEFEHIETDSDLDNIRNSNAFKALIKKMKK